MSLNPLPSSLKSSVGSKSTNTRHGGEVSGRNGGGEGGSYYQAADRSRALCSSWISRLHLRSLPFPSSDLTASHRDGRNSTATVDSVPVPHQVASDAGEFGGVVSHNNKRTISTNESRTPNSIRNFSNSFEAGRYLLNWRFGGPSLPLSPPSRALYGDAGDGSVCGFGPLRVRSRVTTLPGEEGGSLCREFGGVERVLGGGSYGEGGLFPLVRGIAHLGKALCGERGMLGSRVGRQLESVRDEAELGQGNLGSLPRRVPNVQNQVKLSPFFQSRPSMNSGYSTDRNNGVYGLPAREGSVENRDRTKPPDHDDWRSSMRIPRFQSQDLVDVFTSRRPYEPHISIDTRHGSGASLHHIRSDGVAYHDGVDDVVPLQNFGGPHFFHENQSTSNLGRIPASMNETEEPFSFWNMERLSKRNTVSSVSPTLELAGNLSVKRSAKFDNPLPHKFRKLSNED
ncbi:uncharacterized protein LOC122027353 [Zingiber officinale]|uniref:Uncharacterized protein n=1 Tax=Zingiber officinale TaxID=94328 RepID=A0A8J5ESJ9_ZINOF|nr:uncharacterized protein LOC122027353 [Zingiber officinale]XP_042442238.1 uncharacterized protein LOC122027353 [Zingiber officinale]KAG6473165.1 hypothetical protein ZIOFF_067074 [Zingiber officinale]